MDSYTAIYSARPPSVSLAFSSAALPSPSPSLLHPNHSSLQSFDLDRDELPSTSSPGAAGRGPEKAARARTEAGRVVRLARSGFSAPLCLLGIPSFLLFCPALFSFLFFVGLDGQRGSLAGTRPKRRQRGRAEWLSVRGR